MYDGTPQSFFENFVAHEARPEKAAWIILYNGKQMAMRSGKSVWESLSAAKSALNTSIRNSMHSSVYKNEFREEVKDWIYKNVEFKQIR